VDFLCISLLKFNNQKGKSLEINKIYLYFFKRCDELIKCKSKKNLICSNNLDLIAIAKSNPQPATIRN